MKKLIMIVAAAVAIGAAGCGNSQKKEAVDSSAGVEATVAQSSVTELKSENGLPMVVDFSAEWCPPCRQMKPTFEALKNEYAGKVDMVTVDVDASPELAEKYGIQSIPTLVFISADGKELHRTVGLRSESDIKADIANLMK